MAISHILFCFLIIFAGVRADQDECTVTRCTHHGPEVRFPFWLKDLQPAHCGYPGFDLYCTQTNHTMLELPSSVNVSVNEINYTSMVIYISDPNSCLPQQLPNLQLSASPFQLPPPDQYRRYGYKYYQYVRFYYADSCTLFNCSSTKRDSNYLIPINCLSGNGYKVYAAPSDANLYSVPLSSCSKMYNISSVPFQYLLEQPNGVELIWSKWVCGNCYAEGKDCRLKNNSTECFVSQSPIEHTQPSKGIWNKIVLAGIILGVFLIVVVIIAVYYVISSNKIKKEDQVKIARFLEDYKSLKPTRYSYSDVKKITSQFKEKLGQGGYGTVYKGKLSTDILVAVKLLNNSKGNGEEFINEVGTIGRIHHVNVVRLVGYCADGFRRALVYEFLPNDSLAKYISLGKHKQFSLGWEKLQHIALGIAKGIEYLHQGCDQRILHFDIKPHNILLDHNFNPKVADFGLAKLCSKEQSVVSMTAARGTMGYIAPEVFSRNFGNVSYKSDVYSFGMMLIEMVGLRKKKTDVKAQDSDEGYFPEYIYSSLDQGEELGFQIDREGDIEIGKKLTIVGLWCIQWYPVNRPSMKVVIQMLEGEENPAVPPNPFASTTGATSTSSTIKSDPEVISESE